MLRLRLQPLLLAALLSLAPRPTHAALPPAMSRMIHRAQRTLRRASTLASLRFDRGLDTVAERLPERPASLFRAARARLAPLNPSALGAFTYKRVRAIPHAVPKYVAGMGVYYAVRYAALLAMPLAAAPTYLGITAFVPIDLPILFAIEHYSQPAPRGSYADTARRIRDSYRDYAAKRSAGRARVARAIAFDTPRAEGPHAP